MARSSKKSKDQNSGKFQLFDPPTYTESDDDDDLPKDEAGRAKIKSQYVDLLGIRIQKLGGRILNRERINKTLEGVYFICSRCQRVCHNLDDGLVEDEENVNNLCVACDAALKRPPKSVKPTKSKTKSKTVAKKSPVKGKTTKSSAASKTKSS